MKIVHILGVRHQFIKCALIHRATERLDGTCYTVDAVLIHTGRHYEYGMPQVFFEQLAISEPTMNLGMGPRPPHGQLTGQMLVRI